MGGRIEESLEETRRQGKEKCSKGQCFKEYPTGGYQQRQAFVISTETSKSFEQKKKMRPDSSTDRWTKCITCHLAIEGAQWLSGRVLDLRPRGRGFEPHRLHCVVSLSKTY